MADPIVERPMMEDYGVTEDLEGLLPWSWAVERLIGSRNYWLVTADGSGRPHSMPVWGAWDPMENEFWFSCAPTARKARNIKQNAHVVVTGQDTVEVVSVEGLAEIKVSGSDRQRGLDAVVAKYSESEGIPQLREFLEPMPFHRVRPERAFGLIEKPDLFSSSATRWRFT